MMHEQLWQRRQRLIDERRRREDALKAASESKSESKSKIASRQAELTRRQAEAECERLRGELVRLNAAWLEFYEQYPASHGNHLFSRRVSDDESELAALLVRLAVNDFITMRR